MTRPKDWGGEVSNRRSPKALSVPLARRAVPLVLATLIFSLLFANTGAVPSSGATPSEAVPSVGPVSSGAEPSSRPAAQEERRKRAKPGCHLVKKRPKGDTACVKMSVEAWYHTQTSVPGGPPISGAPEVRPYAENTMHVGVTAGREDSRTYLVPDLDGLPFGAEVVAGTLVLTLDEEGSRSPKDADMQACYVSKPPEKSAQGSLDTPPEVECSIQSEAIHRKKPRPLFTIDLEPFASLLAEAGGGIALVPTDKAAEEGASWHISLFAKKNENKKAVAISALLAYEELDTELPPPPIPGDDLPPPGGGTSFDTPSSELPEFPVTDPPIEDPLPDEPVAQEPVEAGEEIAAPVPTAAVPQYPAVWYLPLGLLVGAALLGHLLTKRIVLSR